MDLQRIAQQFQSPGLPMRARFGQVLTVNDDYTINVTVGGETTDAEVEAAAAPTFSQMSASGGIEYDSTDADGIVYRIHDFAGPGTLVVSDVGFGAALDVVVVAGGGAGGGGTSLGSGRFSSGGGGGAGRVVSLSVTPQSGNYVNVVGAGGVGGLGISGGAGGNSQVTFPDASVVIATGGGGGSSSGTGGSGGSGGGGGGGTATTSAGGTAVSGDGLGNNGGSGAGRTSTTDTLRAGGGGGGAGGVGLAASSSGVGGNGGGQASGLPELGLVFIGAGLGVGGGGGGSIQGGESGVFAFLEKGYGGSNDDGQPAGGIGSGGGGGAKTNDQSIGGDGSDGAVFFRYRLTATEDVPVDESDLLSNEVDGVRFLGRSVPLPGQTVLLLTDGQDLVALDSLADPGTTLSPRRYRTSNLSVGNNTDTTVTWGTAVANDLLEVDRNAAGTVSDSRMYARIPGWYQATGAVEWAANSTGYRRAQVLFGGSVVLAGTQTDTDENVAVFQTVSTPTFYMSADDYIELRVRHTAGGALNLTYSSEFVPSLTLTYLGP